MSGILSSSPTIAFLRTFCARQALGHAERRIFTSEVNYIFFIGSSSIARIALCSTSPAPTNSSNRSYNPQNKCIQSWKSVKREHWKKKFYRKTISKFWIRNFGGKTSETYFSYFVIFNANDLQFTVATVDQVPTQIRRKFRMINQKERKVEMFPQVRLSTTVTYRNIINPSAVSQSGLRKFAGIKHQVIGLQIAIRLVHHFVEACEMTEQSRSGFHREQIHSKWPFIKFVVASVEQINITRIQTGFACSFK